jgi:hypothetical protein
MQNLAPKDRLPSLRRVQDARCLQILRELEDDAVAALDGEDVDGYGEVLGVLGDIGEEGGLADYFGGVNI